MKKLFFLLSIVFCILFFDLHVEARSISIDQKTQIPYIIETTISDATSSSIRNKSTNNNVTKTKTTNVKAKNGTVLWSVSITATFTYDGRTSKCIRCSHSAISYAKTWSIQSVSSYKSGNTATATAKHSEGNFSKKFSQSVSIRCSKNGTIS